MAPLVLLFIVLPIAELYVIIQVGQEIGVLWTLALLIADSFLGAALFRSQGRAVWRAFNLALAEGHVPTRETFDGAMIIFGGALLLTPGFITDVFGLILLLPPTRGLVRRGVGRLAQRRVAFGWRVATYRSPGDRPPAPGQAHGPGYDVEGTAREVTDPPPELSSDERG
jgi:UPF0716 protein FxsA